MRREDALSNFDTKGGETLRIVLVDLANDRNAARPEMFKKVCCAPEHRFSCREF